MLKGCDGYTSIAYTQALRTEEDKRMLEATDMVVDAIAAEAGYQATTSFHRPFKRLATTTRAG
ncbi:hypothetical protein DC522_14315 [Microvirga sp. KLBC 81]|nr:hypothetical protein DC522_14315 [Microvirga sp. KLBC 81]